MTDPPLKYDKRTGRRLRWNPLRGFAAADRNPLRCLPTAKGIRQRFKERQGRKKAQRNNPSKFCSFSESLGERSHHSKAADGSQATVLENNSSHTTESLKSGFGEEEEEDCEEMNISFTQLDVPTILSRQETPPGVLLFPETSDFVQTVVMDDMGEHEPAVEIEGRCEEEGTEVILFSSSFDDRARGLFANEDSSDSSESGIFMTFEAPGLKDTADFEDRLEIIPVGLGLGPTAAGAFSSESPEASLDIGSLVQVANEAEALELLLEAVSEEDISLTSNEGTSPFDEVIQDVIGDHLHDYPVDELFELPEEQGRSESPMTWISHDKVSEDGDDRPVREICIPSPERGIKLIIPSGVSSRDTLAASIKESMNLDPVPTKEDAEDSPPSINRLVKQGVDVVPNNSSWGNSEGWNPFLDTVSRPESPSDSPRRRCRSLEPSKRDTPSKGSPDCPSPSDPSLGPSLDPLDKVASSKGSPSRPKSVSKNTSSDTPTTKESSSSLSYPSVDDSPKRRTPPPSPPRPPSRRSIVATLLSSTPFSCGVNKESMYPPDRVWTDVTGMGRPPSSLEDSGSSCSFKQSVSMESGPFTANGKTSSARASSFPLTSPSRLSTKALLRRRSNRSSKSSVPSSASPFPRTSPPGLKQRSPSRSINMFPSGRVLGKSSFDVEAEQEAAFMMFEKAERTPVPWPLSSVASKYSKDRLELDGSPKSSKKKGLDHDLDLDIEESPIRRRFRESKRADGLSAEARDSYKQSPFRAKLAESLSVDTFGAPGMPAKHDKSFPSLRSPSFDEGAGCGALFDDDDDDTTGAPRDYESGEEEVVFEGDTSAFPEREFLTDLSTEIMHAFEELAREGSEVMSGLMKMH